MSAFSSYRAGDYDTAVASLDRFVKLYPNHESTPYAYYMIAICYYEQISDVGRDQKVTDQSMQALREVVRRFPDTEYARDAKIKLDLTQDHLAGKEMQIGRYYERRKEYLAAINRFRFVVENFQTTSHVPEALHRLVECFLKLGVVDEATRYASVLGYNFPNSIWYRDSYALLNGGAKPVEFDEDDIEEPEAPVQGDDSKLKQPPAEAAPYEPVESAPVQSHDNTPGAVPETPAVPEPPLVETPKPEEPKAEEAAPAAAPVAAPVMLEAPKAEETSPVEAKPEDTQQAVPAAPEVPKKDSSFWGSVVPDFDGGSTPQEAAKPVTVTEEPAKKETSFWDDVVPSFGGDAQPGEAPKPPPSVKESDKKDSSFWDDVVPSFGGDSQPAEAPKPPPSVKATEPKEQSIWNSVVPW